MVAGDTELTVRWVLLELGSVVLLGVAVRGLALCRSVLGARLGADVNVKICFNGSQQGGLTEKLAVNAAGRIAIVNSTFRPNVESHVWLLLGKLPH